MATIHEKLMKVQAETKCRKSQYNTFGKYNYRNVEDIWEAVKPVAANYGAVLTCTADRRPILRRSNGGDL